MTMKRKALHGNPNNGNASPARDDVCSRTDAVIHVDVSERDLSSAFNPNGIHDDDGGGGGGDRFLEALFQKSKCRGGSATMVDLDASMCRLGPEGASHLLSSLSDGDPSIIPSIRRMRLRRNAIGSVGGRAVGKFLSTPYGASVESMDVGLNDVKAGGGGHSGREPTAAESLADALRSNSTLRELTMDRCALGPDGATRLADALAAGNNDSLRTLEVAGNMIGPSGGERLFRALGSNSGLEGLGLRMNRIGGRGDKGDVRALAEALVGGRCRVAFLDLSYNDLRCEGCSVLSEALMVDSCPLVELMLEKNDVKDDGAESLANALVTNRTLRTLVLKGNAIGDAGAVALGKMLGSNDALRTLDLSSCRIGNEGGAAIGRGLAENSTLQRLDLNKNSLGSGGSDTFAFAVGVTDNAGLRSLSLAGNGLGNGDGEGDRASWGSAIAAALSGNTSLREVDLSNNALRDPSIIDAVASHPSILRFDFSDNELEHVSIETQLLLSKRMTATPTDDDDDDGGLDMDLSLNPLASPPLGRLADGANLRDYLALLANEKTAVTRIRLMVLGFGGVGKSTFCGAVTTENPREFRRSLVPVSRWGVDRLADWAGLLGTSWAGDAARLIVDGDVAGRDLSKFVDAADGDGDENGDGVRPSRLLLDACSSKYPSIDADSFARAVSALDAKGYLSTVGAVKVEGTIDLGKRMCSLVDFAGQVEFLVSHQLLLSSMHTLCMVIQPAPSFGRPAHRHSGSWEYWSKFLASLGDRRRGSLLLAVSQLDKLDGGGKNGTNVDDGTEMYIEREFAHIKRRASGAISCKSPLRLDYSPENMAETISAVKRTLSKSLDEVAHSWWVPSSYELVADILQCVAKRKSSNHELPVLTKSELMLEIDAFSARNPGGSSLLTSMKTDSQLLQRAINYLEAVGDVMQAGEEWLLIDPIGWFSAFLAHFIKDDLAVSTIQVDATTLRRQRGTVNLEDIVHALQHEYKSPRQHVSQIMSLLSGLELCVPLRTEEQVASTSNISASVPLSYFFPCLLPPLISQSELASCGLMTCEHFSDISAVRGHRFRESSGFIPPGLFVGILARMYRQLECDIMHPRRMWKDHAVLVLNNKKTRVVLRCDLDKAIIDVVACASDNECLFVGAAKGQASIVKWLVHLIKIFLRSYSQLNFEESWLCPNPWCHGIDRRGSIPSEYEGSDFLLSPTSRRRKTHDCNVEGCWRFLGAGHNLEPMALCTQKFDVCRHCNKEPVFTLREKIA